MILTRSDFESNVINKLQENIDRNVNLRDKIDYEYESEYLEYTVKKKYLPDLLIRTLNNKKIYVELKGYFKPSDRGKMRKVKEAHPDLDIRFVFERDNRLYPKSHKSNRKYSDWCEKFGFPYAIGEIPVEWLKE